MTTWRVIPRSAGPALSVLLIGALATALAAPAHASAYRYWTYWQAGPDETGWIYATQGPATFIPEDGSVEGWSFAISSDTGAAAAAPGRTPDFGSVCGTVPLTAGSKRIALIVDSGPASIAPDGEAPLEQRAECVVTDVDATAYDVLRSVLEVRTEDGLVCGLGGYPARECAPILDDAEVAALATAAHGSSDPPSSPDAGAVSPEAAADGPDSSDSPVATVAVIVLLLLAGSAALWLRRRRQS